MQDRLRVKFDLSLDGMQLIQLAVLAIVGSVLIGWGFWEDCGYTHIPQVNTDRVSLACEFIDPNTADYASLRRLPGVGDIRARAIISYRQTCENQPAFSKLEDLKKVSGISDGTLREAMPLMEIKN
jgi:competence ComEA-like helix-hairpin-helix protein